VEREQEMEKIVRKKLEMERMKEQQMLMENMLRKRELEVGQIAGEIEKKDNSNAALLKRALERGDILAKQMESGALDLKT